MQGSSSSGGWGYQPLRSWPPPAAKKSTKPITVELSDSDSDLEVLEAPVRYVAFWVDGSRQSSSAVCRGRMLNVGRLLSWGWVSQVSTPPKPASNQCVYVRAVSRNNGAAYWGDISAGMCYIKIDLV